MMRVLCLSMVGLLLVGCQTNHDSREESEDSYGNRFYVTHEVDSNKPDYVYLKRNKQVRRTTTQHHEATSSYEQDGAPAGPVPVSFKKVVPKYEPTSRYGNPDVYQVMGKKYEVMTNATGYKSRGIASWYGTKFHKGRTSSGEKYDMYALTAAHKTLPLPTYIRVKNLNNGKTAIVKVNDRGPFHNDRILDLSYAAAAKLGIFPIGTAPVEIEALKTTGRNLHYYVQAGAFASLELADRLQAKLGKITTSPVYIQKYQQKYLVQVGPFATKEMVADLKNRLERNDIHGSFSMLM
jgi:rare lipoprotein A